jgi:octaprenyl-diphosphate synthase
VEGKKSLPVLLYLNQHPKAGDLVERCFAAARAGGTEVPEIEEFIGELSAAGVLKEAETRGLSLIGEAREVFGALPGTPCEADARSSEARELLAGLTNLIS